MKRVYFDSNTFRYLKNNPSLLRKIIDNKNRFSFYYSLPHILDLLSDNSDKKYEDLELMETLVDDNYLVLNENGNVVHAPSLPLSLYNTLNTEIEFAQDIINAEKISLEEIFNELINKSFIPEFKKLLNQENILDKNSNISQLFISLFKNPDTYKRLRYYIIKSLNLKTKHKINIDNKSFNKKLVDTPFKTPFLNFVDNTLSYQKTVTMFEFQHFITSYILLNVLAIDNEKNKKASLKGTVNDGQHSYFSAHCDYLISDDKGLIQKSKALFKLLNIDTKIFTLMEFEKKLDSPLKIETKTLYYDALKYELDNAFIIDIKYLKKSKQTIFKPSLNHFDYFNEFLYIESLICIPHFIFYKKVNNYSFFPFLTEIEKITNKMVKIFGEDIFGRMVFKKNEEQEIITGTWNGRKWSFYEFIIHLNFNVKEFKLIYSVEKRKNYH